MRFLLERKGLGWTLRFGDSVDTKIPVKKFECRILNSDGDVVFEQADVEAPAFWSDQAVTIFADKYFRGNIGQPNREYSVFEVIDRVVRTIANWGCDNGYFAETPEAVAFEQDLRWILVNQMASFNSPVWFNFGVTDERHQGSACFILEVQDDMGSITNRAVEESHLFQNGSGSGANNSRLRGSKEPLSRGGYASGPVSFMRGWDAFAGIIKSGGKTRRAAKMEILDVDHPDIEEFIACKWIQDQKATALQDAGFGSGNINEMVEVFHQNANHSVRVTDEFMEAVIANDKWNLLARNKNKPVPVYTTGSANPSFIRMIDGGYAEVMQELDAREIWDQIIECTWQCGDPGIVFDDNVNKWNTVPDVSRIESSNPCGEYFGPNNTACNLASLNLTRFFGCTDDGLTFARDNFIATVETMITAMDIIAGSADYPTKKITENSHRLRALGIGYAGVGHMLMSLGMPYDSDEARKVMSMTTALMTGVAYNQSTVLMQECGFCEQLNRDNMLAVILKHIARLGGPDVDTGLENMLDWKFIRQVWHDALYAGELVGFRNSQVSVLAPTGTIAFGMSLGHSTGIEPIYQFLAMKKMTGAGTIILDTTQAVQEGLQALGMGPFDMNDLMEGNLAETLLQPIIDSHVFDTASDINPIGVNISYMGHLKMMAAVQPFLSGGISKTVNLPNSATHEDISNAYFTAWEMGLKAVALYRDGSKYEQPYASSSDEEIEETEAEDVVIVHDKSHRVRRPPPDERKGTTHKAVIGGQKFYITANVYPDDEELCEIFVTAAKEGSAVSGLYDTIATLFSICIQYGVPLDTLTSRFKDTRFEPNGVTNHRDIPIALSPVDYIMKWLELKFPDEDEEPKLEYDEDSDDRLVVRGEHSGQLCSECGGMAIRSGRCHVCTNCGASTGCG